MKVIADVYFHFLFGTVALFFDLRQYCLGFTSYDMFVVLFRYMMIHAEFVTVCQF